MRFPRTRGDRPYTCATRQEATSSRFPRTRGDRPGSDIIRYEYSSVPPHTRG